MKKNNEIIKKYLFLFFIFTFGILSGLYLWNKITLPYHDVWGVVGKLTVICFNPSNNIVRFIILILSPAFLLSIAYLCNLKMIERFWFKRNTIVPDSFNSIFNLPDKSSTFYSSVILIFFCIIIIFTWILYIYLSLPSVFDPFHEGETLGPSISYLAGKTPYKDFIFWHGVYQDPLRSVIAFNIFGKSIVSVRILEGITQIISLTLFFLMIIKIYNNDLVISFMAILIIYLSTFSFFLFLIFPEFPTSLSAINYTRDIATYSFIITIIYIRKLIIQKDVSKIKFYIIIFLFSFIPISAFGCSIDRGFYLLAGYVIISIILYFFFYHSSKLRIHYLISSLLGISSALVLLFIVLRGNFTEFLKFTFLIIPKYKEYLSGDIYNVFDPKYMFICMLIAFNTFWITYKFFQEYNLNDKLIVKTIINYIRKYLLEFCLLLLSVFFFRSALGRTDWGHFVYSTPLTYVLTLLILFKYYLFKEFSKKLIRYLVLGLIIIFSVSFTFLSYKIISTSKIAPFKIDDSQLIPENYKATISFLINNLDSNENFFTMTSEACWYYFINKPCPTRFPVVWFAAPNFYQEEVVKDLDDNNVKLILYKNNMWSNAVDGFDNEIRFPIIINYIKQNYEFYKKIDDNEVWIKKLNKH